ncbi:phage portal protein [Victivallis sp. Marseille-Q1083]|uniref:phage portal protein n=1 Tax=Victivallis sp. Marseille-Q1083 TaxID=2717288 RepID=UPI00158EE5C5|nr:phage portal protein [Victivallis sp. Marseille-Q1083]
MDIDIDKACFTFGEPEPVHGERILDYLGVFPTPCGEYYVPPIDLWGLAKMRSANGQHGSCIVFRRNQTAKTYISGPLPVADLRANLIDLLTFGNSYLLVERNRLGGIAGLRHLPGLNMRVKADGVKLRRLLNGGRYQDYTPDQVLHLKEYDPCQQIYGIPDWIGGLQSALLNQDATLFRRRYFVNGAHLGYILYSRDPKLQPALRDALLEKFRDGKGVGNFKSVFLHIPNGGENAFQLMNIGDISQKDEFANVKNISADDVRAAHRVPPVLMGLAPEGAGSLGDPVKVAKVYVSTEVVALAQNYLDLNSRLPKNLQFKFNFEVKEYE